MSDPAFLFYSSDFLTGVSDLTMKERGQYITLLCLQHQKGHFTKKMVGIATPDATADVIAKFEVDTDGKYFNVRLDKEKKKREEYSEKQRNRALDGWKKRRKVDATAIATAMPIQKENRNEDVNINEDVNGIIPFDDFWNLYDYKKDRKKCKGKWSKLDKETQEKVIKLIPAYISENPDKKFRKYPYTFLNNESWDDVEYTPIHSPSYSRGLELKTER